LVSVLNDPIQSYSSSNLIDRGIAALEPEEAEARDLAVDVELCYVNGDFLIPGGSDLAITSTQLSLEQLTRLARRGAVAAVETIEAEIAALRRAFPDGFGTIAGGSTAVADGRRRNTLSAAGRAAIARAQKARWAKVKDGHRAGTRKTSTGGGRKRLAMSAAQRKAVGERMKKYWATRRKANAKKS
jgi:hypothetical protein